MTMSESPVSDLTGVDEYSGSNSLSVMKLSSKKMEFAVKRSEVHEIFMRIDMKHSYFSNYFIICLPSFFSIIKVII